MRLIEVKKSLNTGLNTGRFNLHYINVNHIVDVYEWSDLTIILLSTGDKIECVNALSDILTRINCS